MRLIGSSGFWTTPTSCSISAARMRALARKHRVRAPKQPDDYGRLWCYRCPLERSDMKWVWAALFVAVYAGGGVGSFEFFQARFSCSILKDIDPKTCGLGLWVNSFAWP